MNIIVSALVLIQNIDKPPISKDGETNLLMSWIISVLVLTVIALFVSNKYEVKNLKKSHNEEMKTITSRLDTVIDQSMERMERKDQAKTTALEKLNSMMLQLKEIIVLAQSFKK